MSVDGPPSNISNIEIDTSKALLNPNSKNQELDSTNNIISPRIDYSPKLAASVTGS